MGKWNLLVSCKNKAFFISFVRHTISTKGRCVADGGFPSNPLSLSRLFLETLLDIFIGYFRRLNCASSPVVPAPALTSKGPRRFCCCFGMMSHDFRFGLFS